MKQSTTIFIFSICTLWLDGGRSDGSHSSDNTKHKFMSSDYVIGALFPICDTDFYGIEITEAAFFAIDLINRREDILPNVTLGIDIRDYCGSAEYAILQCKSLLADALSRSNETTNIFSREQKNIESPLIGIIGTEDLESSAEVQHFLKIFDTVQIGYSEPFNPSSEEGRSPYYTYFSIIPGNYYMTEAILSILVANNWNYVAVIHSSDTFGIADLKDFQELAPNKGICVSGIITNLELSSVMNYEEDEYLKKKNEEYLEYLWNTDILPVIRNVEVIVCYCTSDLIYLLYKVLLIARSRLAKEFVVISGDRWPPTHPHPPEIQDKAIGGIRLRMKHIYFKDFDDYFLGLNLENNKRNPWFVQFWQNTFKCQNNSIGNSDMQNCSSLEMLAQDYNQNPKVPFVIESIFILAQGLHDMLQGGCRDYGTDPILPLENNFYKECYLTYVRRVTFDFYGELIEFDSWSRTPKIMKYDVLNFQLLKNGYYNYVKIGEYKIIKQGFFGDEWKQLEMKSTIMYPLNKTSVKSTCSVPCLPTHAKVLKVDKCCWDCVACGPLQILKNSTQCVNCTHGFMSNFDKTNCIQIPMECIGWLDARIMIITSVSILSIFLTVFTSYIFLKHEHTPVVKSSSKELCYIMFVGMFAANLTPFVTIPEPSIINCIVIWILPPISFTFIYAALFVKTNRIARMLAMKKKKFPNLNPKFLSSKAQVIFTIVLIGFEVTICLYFLRKHPIKPEDIFKPREDSYYGTKTCPLKEDMLMEVFTFVGILILICAYYAFKTRNLPQNFNEAKNIGFAMYATILTDVSFGFIYVESEFKILAMNLCISINILIVLIFLFAPKLYVILWLPEKNTRANFITSTEIRCFIANEDLSNGGKTFGRESST